MTYFKSVLLFTLHILRATHIRLVHVNILSLWLNCSAAWLCIDVSKHFLASYFSSCIFKWRMYNIQQMGVELKEFNLWRDKQFREFNHSWGKELKEFNQHWDKQFNQLRDKELKFNWPRDKELKFNRPRDKELKFHRPRDKEFKEPNQPWEKQFNQLRYKELKFNQPCDKDFNR